METQEPRFLRLEDIMHIHQRSLERFGGAAGLRDQRMLLSALAQPEASFGGTFLHADLFEMAAAYLFHLAQNHPFVDGNKRIGLAAAVAFLHMNGWDCLSPQPAAVNLTLATARGELDKPAIAAFFRAHSRRRGQG